MLGTSLLIAIGVAAGGPLFATHEGTVEDTAVRWHSTILVDGPAHLVLRRPLPASLAVEVQGAAIDRDAAGATTGFVVDRRGRISVDVTVREPLQPGDVVLHPPLVEAVERITLLGDGVRFRPDAALGLEQHIGRFAAADVDRHARAGLEGVFPSPRRPNTPPLWLAPSTSTELSARGLRGTLARHTSVTLIAGTLGLAAVLIALLLVGVRVLTKQAESERADRLIDAEWRDVVKRSSG